MLVVVPVVYLHLDHQEILHHLEVPVVVVTVTLLDHIHHQAIQ